MKIHDFFFVCMIMILVKIETTWYPDFVGGGSYERCHSLEFKLEG